MDDVKFMASENNNKKTIPANVLAMVYDLTKTVGAPTAICLALLIGIGWGMQTFLAPYVEGSALFLQASVVTQERMDTSISIIELETRTFMQKVSQDHQDMKDGAEAIKEDTEKILHKIDNP